MSKKKYLLSMFILLTLMVSTLVAINEQKTLQKEATEVIRKGEISFNQELKLDYYKKLYNNDDIVAKLDIASTHTLLVQSSDNQYYLSHLLDKSFNILGTPFLDYRTNIGDKKIIIYGHNSKKYDTPLKVLEKYSDKSFYKENSIITITSDKEFSYKIFSVAYFKNDFTYFEVDITDFDKHIKYLKENSIYDTGVSVNGEDEIVLLQTCSNEKEGTYIVISAKRI